MSKAIDYSYIKKCLIHKTSKDDWDNHITELFNLMRKIEVVRNFMSDERNFENSEGQWELQSIAENIIAWEELTSDYAEIFNAGLSMLQEKFRDDRQKFYDRQKFAEDKHQWKQSYKIVAGLLERRQ